MKGVESTIKSERFGCGSLKMGWLRVDLKRVVV